MTWDDRVSFVLADSLQIKKIAFTDTVLDQAGDEGGFDTDVAIATGELSKLIPDLIEALGGEGRTELGQPAAQPGAETFGRACGWQRGWFRGQQSTPQDGNPRRGTVLSGSHREQPSLCRLAGLRLKP